MKISIVLMLALARVGFAQVEHGSLVLFGDEWSLSDSAFASNPANASALARNLGNEFADGSTGDFLVISDLPPNVFGPRGFNGAALAAEMIAAGHRWTIDPFFPIATAGLLAYDGVFLAGTLGSGSANAPVLAEYIEAGGNIAIMGGAAQAPCTNPICEANSWNMLLNSFGLALAISWFPFNGLMTVPIQVGTHPLLQGVSSLDWGYGHLVIDTDLNGPYSAIAARGDFTAFGGGPQGNVNDIIATYNLGAVTPAIPFCEANANSSGLPGTVWAIGSSVVAQNNLALGASQLPTNTLGYFLASRSTSFVPFAGGSTGNLCLGGAIGRFNQPSHVLNTGPAGVLHLPMNLQSVPSPTGFIAIIPGDTFHFQAWFLDTVAGGATSNFTYGATVLFH